MAYIEPENEVIDEGVKTRRSTYMSGSTSNTGTFGLSDRRIISDNFIRLGIIWLLWECCL